MFTGKRIVLVAVIGLFIAVPLLIQSAQIGVPRHIAGDVPHLPSNFHRLPGPQAVVEMPVAVENTLNGSVHLQFTDPPLVIDEIELDGSLFSTVRMDGEGSTETPGEPDLPRVTRLVMIDHHGNFGIQINDAAYSETELPHTIAPMQPLEEQHGNLDSGTWPPDAEIYSANEWFPPEIITISEPATLRDVRFAVVTVYPVQVNPVTGQMRIYDYIDATVQNLGGTGQNELTHLPTYISPSFKKLYETIENFRGSHLDELPEQPGKHLYICPPGDSVTTRVQSLVNWRRKKGIDAYFVTTLVTGTSSTNINNYIEAQYTQSNGELEFVTLIGDPGAGVWSLATGGFDDLDNLYAANGTSDPVPDIAVGRLPASSASELGAMVNNIINYESNPFMGQTNWFERAWCASHTDDVPSNPSTKEYTRQIMLQHGLDSVYWNVFVDFMSTPILESRIEAGVCVFNDRMSWVGEFVPSQLSGIQNGQMLPFVLVITCGTGTFSVDDALSEEWVRLGTIGTPRGAIGAIGMSGTSTHARYNNIIDGGAMQTLFALDIREQGLSLVGAKLELFKNYWDVASGAYQIDVENFCGWMNLMGDPGVPIWLSVPEVPVVSHALSVPTYTDNVSVEVELNGNPAEHALVGLAKGTETFARGYTDENGHVNLPVSTPTPGYLYVTVSRPDIKTYVDSIQIAAAPAALAFQSLDVDDDGAGGTIGDDDNVLNPGETIDLDIVVRNSGTSQAITGISGTLTTDQAGIQIINDTQSYPDLSVGATGSPLSDFRIQVSSVFNAEPIPFYLNLSWTGGGTAVLRIDLTPVAADVAFVSSAYLDGNSRLDPGETGDLTVTLNNSGNRSLSSATAILRSLDNHVTVNDSLGTYGNVAGGANATNSSDPFNVSALVSTAGGYQAALQLVVIDANGVRDSTNFLQTVGVAVSTSPTGPDGYGYYAYDNTELQPPGSASSYEWVEIAPALGGPGVSLGFTDGGEDQDDVVSRELPFDFTFYGQSFDSITICSNGWIAFGTYPNIDYRNWHMGSPLGPPNQVAAFWDDLQVAGIANGGVYTWYDAGNQRYIVEWITRTLWSDQDEVFQAILYNPDSYPTVSGDGKILVQYQTFTLTTNQIYFDNDYATVGIQNGNHTQGLEICYWNAYTPGSATLASGRAIMFTTDPTGAINPVFSLLSPNGGETWFVDSTASIIWQPSGVAGNISIELSRNGVSGPWETIAASTVNDGQHSWVVTNPTSSSCRIRIISLLTPDSTDQSVEDFSIASMVTVLSEDFENGAAGWTHTAAPTWGEQWHISTERANSGIQSYKCGDSGTGTYASHQDARLESPLVNNLPADARLTFYHQIESELSNAFPDSAYDGGLIEISVDGTEYIPIDPIAGYPKTFRYQSGGGNPATGPLLGRPCYAGTVAAWVQEQVNLSAFAGNDIRVRFRFGADNINHYEGWYIDDVQIFGISTNVEPIVPTGVTIYLNGSDLLLQWTADENIAYRIYSATTANGPFDTLVGSSFTNSFLIPDGAATDKKFYHVVGWDGN